MNYTFTGWKTFVVKQTFEIEAESKQEAIDLLLELDQSYGLDERFLDFNTNKISSPEKADFYDDEDELVEGTQE